MDGIRGIAPILQVHLDDVGRFVSGRVIATTQIRPAGPSVDPVNSVIALLRGLNLSAFPEGELSVAEDGTLGRR